MTKLYDAHRQWAVRPPDERFDSLDSLYDKVQSRRVFSHEETRSLKSLDLKALENGALAVNGESPQAKILN